MNEPLENSYENIIKELDQKLGRTISIKVRFPKQEIGHFDGILVMIRDEACVLRNKEKKQYTSVPYNIITKIT